MDTTTMTEGRVDERAGAERRVRPVNWFIGIMVAVVLVAAGFLGGTMFALNEASPTAVRLGVVALALLAPLSMLGWLVLRLRREVKALGR